MSEQIKAKFARAKQLIDAKKYDDAITILAAIDHPRAMEWLKRIEALQGVGKRKQGKRVQSCLLAIGVFIVLLVIAFGAIVAWYRVYLSPRLNVSIACSYATSDGYTCDTDTIMANYPDAVKRCDEIHGYSQVTDFDAYAVCLRNEGVDMGARQ